LTAKAEEELLIEQSGEQYREYKKRFDLSLAKVASQSRKLCVSREHQARWQ